MIQRGTPESRSQLRNRARDLRSTDTLGIVSKDRKTCSQLLDYGRHPGVAGIGHSSPVVFGIVWYSCVSVEA